MNIDQMGLVSKAAAAATTDSVKRAAIIMILFDAKPCERAAAATNSVKSLLLQFRFLG